MVSNLLATGIEDMKRKNISIDGFEIHAAIENLLMLFSSILLHEITFN